MNTISMMLDFIDRCPTPFHAIDVTAERLKREGFTSLQESEQWRVQPGKNYFVTRNGSSIIAFKVPLSGWGSLHLTASHSDAPCYKIKENGELLVRGYRTLNTEPYGGMIASSWLDRPLSVAGRLLVRTEKGLATKLVAIDRDLLIIPHVAIHMNRTINDGYRYNPQVDLLPLLGMQSTQPTALLDLVANAAAVEKEKIVASELSLYNRMKGTVLGAENELIAAPRIDDLGCVFTTLQGFLTADCAGLSVLCVLDNEEVGSTTKQGACSTFLADTLRRLCAALGGSEEDYLAALPGSFLLSADNAHALHPNHPELCDQSNPVLLNKGIVLKFNANQKYTTDAVSAAMFRMICEKAGVPLQTFANRSDLPGGSTLGNLSNTQLSVNAADIGLPQLAMHAACETAGVQDAMDMICAVRTFYETSISSSSDGNFQLDIT